MAAKKPTPAARRKAATAKRKAAALLKAQKASFLIALADTHLVSEAAKAAGIHRQRAYEWREADESFARGWAEIEERSTELLEREAYRRAAVGTDKGIYHQGDRVDTVKEYSDVLLIFLLKARRPDTYREQHRLEVSGVKDAPPIELNVSSREASDAAREFLARVSGA